MPSPTSTTVPTFRVSASASKVSIADLMMLTISSERMAIWKISWCAWRARALPGARHEAFAEPLEAAPDAGVIEGVADADGEPPDQRWVDLDPKLDSRARHLGELALERLGLVDGERERRLRKRVDHAFLAVEQAAVLRGHVAELIDLATLDEEVHQAANGLGHAILEDAVDDGLPLARRQGRIVEEVLGRLRRRQVDGQLEVVRELLEARLANALEQRFGVAARGGGMGLGHQVLSTVDA